MQRNDQGNPLPTSPCRQGEGESTTIRRATAEEDLVRMEGDLRRTLAASRAQQPRIDQQAA